MDNKPNDNQTLCCECRKAAWERKLIKKVNASTGIQFADIKLVVVDGVRITQEHYEA